MVAVSFLKESVILSFDFCKKMVDNSITMGIIKDAKKINTKKDMNT